MLPRTWPHIDPLREFAFQVARPDIAELIVRGTVLLTEQTAALRTATAEEPGIVPRIERVIRDTANGLAEVVAMVPGRNHRRELTRRIERHFRQVRIGHLDRLRRCEEPLTSEEETRLCA